MFVDVNRLNTPVTVDISCLTLTINYSKLIILGKF